MSVNGSVLTLVMTIEYNGFAYAGFQRQTSTPRDGNSSNSDTKRSDTSRKRSHPQSNRSKSKTPITIQQQIEDALVQWTDLSISTLRVRGAGRTDKGVHASGQVVAFDVPLSLLNIPNGADDSTFDNVLNDEKNHKEVLSEHSLPLLQEAYQKFCNSRDRQCSSQCSIDDSGTRRKFLDLWQIRRAISTRLPPDIVIRSVWLWTGDFPFEARQRIVCKTYTYKVRFRSLSYIDAKNDGGGRVIHPICNAGPHLLRRIQDQNDVWLCTWPLDETKLQSACQAFVGVHDFHNFVHKEEHKKRAKCIGSTEGSKRSYVTDLLCFNVLLEEEDEDQSTAIPPVYNALFTLKAKGFHRQMVRNLVGCVVDVSRGLYSHEDIPVLLRETTSSSVVGACENKTVNAAPSCGLCLEKVSYECNHFMKAQE